MRFLKPFLINLGLLKLAGILLFVLFQDLMGSAYKLLRPLALALVVVAALPRRR